MRHYVDVEGGGRTDDDDCRHPRDNHLESSKKK